MSKGPYKLETNVPEYPGVIIVSGPGIKPIFFADNSFERALAEATQYHADLCSAYSEGLNHKGDAYGE